MVSPCVQFNNNPQSTKSYDFVREHNDAVNRIDFIVPRAEIKVDFEPGTVTDVKQHDGSILAPRQADPAYDPHDRAKAMAYLQERHAQAKSSRACSTSMRTRDDLHANLNTVETPLNKLGEKELCPGSKAWPRSTRVSVSIPPPLTGEVDCERRKEQVAELRQCRRRPPSPLRSPPPPFAGEEN